MCGLGYESIDQLMVSYAIAQTVWYLVSTHTGVCLNFQDGFGFGGWLISNNYSLFIKSVIAAASWFLWKAWCDKIFRNIDANCYVIVCKAFAHVTKFYNATALQLGKCLILNNFSNADGPFLFISNDWNDVEEVSGAGFLYLILTI